MGIAIVAVGGAGVADASSGHPLLLGQTNKASGTTTISSKHTPLALHGPAGQPPLKVSSSTQVPKLNSSLLGGLSAAQIIAEGGKITQVDAPMANYIGTALCPSGTHPIGGGILPDTTTADDPAFIAASFPHINDTTNAIDGWEAAAGDFDGTYTGGGFVFAYCTTAPVTETTQATAAARQQQRTVPQEIRTYEQRRAAS